MVWPLFVLVAAFLYAIYCFCFKRQPVYQCGSQRGRALPPIRSLLDNPDNVTYGLRNFVTPKVSGWLFKLLIDVQYSLFGKYVLLPYVMHQSNADCMKGRYLPESPTFSLPARPLRNHAHSNKNLLQKLLERETREDEMFHFPSVADFVRAYRSEKCTPVDVARAVLKAIEDSNNATPPLRAVVETKHDVVMALANASTQRWKRGETLSLLDGVPIAIKGEFHVKPYDLCAGTSYVPIISQGIPESCLVEKFKSAGAVIVGLTNLQEFGAGTLGSNSHQKFLTARNPYDPQCYAGGSSSGSAVSVAAGLCPIALGADGGGSVRLPASICGVVGMKPTNGLLERTGAFPHTYTVCSAGPLCSSILDTAICMDTLSREGESGNRLLSLEGLGDTSLSGLSVGIYWKYFEHADAEIVQSCKAAVSQLEALGANIVKITIPELEESRVAHSVTIISEFANSLGLDIDNHFDQMTLESLLIVGIGFQFSAVEYLNAQKQRTRAIEAMKFFFDELKVDLIVTPATAIPAPKISPESLSKGISDSENSTALMRFCFLGNLTGLPAIVLPVGYTSTGLPIGLHLMGQWHEDGKLIKVGYALEKSGAFSIKKPKVFYDIVKTATFE